MDAPRPPQAPLATKPLYPFQRDDATLGNIKVCRRRLGRGVLSLRYTHSKHKVSGFKDTNISQHMTDVVEHLLNGTHAEAVDAAKDLPIDERSLLRRVVDRSGVSIPKELHDHSNVDVDRLKTRFDIVAGEIRVGNDSPELLTELNEIVEQMVEAGLIGPATAKQFRIKYNLE